MKCEEEFDETAGFSRLEATPLSGGIIHPITQVFYNPIDQFYHPKDDRTRLTKDAEEIIRKATQDVKRIHRKYRKD